MKNKYKIEATDSNPAFDSNVGFWLCVIVVLFALFVGASVYLFLI